MSKTLGSLINSHRSKKNHKRKYRCKEYEKCKDRRRTMETAEVKVGQGKKMRKEDRRG